MRLFGTALLGTLTALSGCGGSSGGATTTGGATTPGGTATPTAPLTYTVGGSISGLLAATGLVLQNNAANDLTVAADGTFTFATAQADASAYSVTIKTQPTGKTCAVTGDSGTVASANVTSISVTCVSNSQKFGFVANNFNNSVYAFSLDTATGTATSVGSAITTGLSAPVAVAVDPSGRFLYAANNASGTVSAFAFNFGSGTLTVAGAAIAAGSGPFAVAVAPNQISLSTAKVVYVANSNDNTVSTFTINTSSGALTILGAATTVGTFPRAIAVDPSGKFAFIANFTSADVFAYTINQTTGAISPNGTITTGAGPQSIAIDRLSKFAYVANAGANTVSVFNVSATGVLTSNLGALCLGVPGRTCAANSPNSIAISPNGEFAYVSTTSGILGFTIDAGTGLLTAMNAGNPFNTGNNFNSVSVNAGSTFLYATNTVTGNLDVFTITAVTGDLVGPTSVAIPFGANAVHLPITTTR